MIKALLFDFDGIILDTETIEYKAFQEVSRDYQIEMTLEQWGQWAGMVGVRRKAADYVAERAKDAFDAESFQRRFIECYDKLASQLTVFPGIIEIIEEARQSGLKIALATSSNFEWSGGFLKKYGLLPYFDLIQTRDNVTHVKPHPEIYQAALRGLGIEPHEAIAFEDSPVGSKAAKAAGVYCIVVPSTVTKHYSFEHADAVVPTLGGRTLQELIRMVDKGAAAV
ncbi:HAD family hydrolase [Paenibacillus thermotolerans]|uniref:HAD family hydrolase n=1 Tax=Paenibacillus thermotolerans TaxID=3027807 RepID=UPI002368E7A6|nr:MULTISPECIES: HAD-IA family hydrolase [unclassified Paenibacillus]